MIARPSLCPEKLGSNPGQGSKGITFSGWHGLDISRTLGQCLNATNSFGKNAYRTFLKYLQLSFQFVLRTQPTFNLINNNIDECLYSVQCYRSVRENAHGIVSCAVCVLPSLVTKSRPRRFATRAGLGDSCR